MQQPACNEDLPAISSLEAPIMASNMQRSERISSSFSKKIGFRHLQELAWQNSSHCFVSLKIL